MAAIYCSFVVAIVYIVFPSLAFIQCNDINDHFGSSTRAEEIQKINFYFSLFPETKLF